MHSKHANNDQHEKNKQAGQVKGQKVCVCGGGAAWLGCWGVLGLGNKLGSKEELLSRVAYKSFLGCSCHFSVVFFLV